MVRKNERTPFQKGNPFAIAKRLANREQRQRLSGSKSDSKALRVGLWNCNSLGSSQTKFEFISKFMKSGSNSLLALTELAPDDSVLPSLFSKQTEFPVLTAPNNMRVGLCVPTYLRSCVEIVDSWQHCESRKRKSQIACQITTYKIRLSTVAITISVVYLAPDATAQCAKLMCAEILRLNDLHKLYCAMGDFNLDQRIEANRIFFKDQFGGFLHQTVKNTTRHATRKMNDSVSESNTIIDLVFLNKDLKVKLKGPNEIKGGTPSDHNMVISSFDLKVPTKYVIKEYYLDPTRRPPIPKAKLDSVRLELSNKFQQLENHIEEVDQDVALDTISSTIREVLDRHNPLNKPEKLSKKIFRFIMSKSTMKLKKAMRKAQDLYRTAKRRRSSDHGEVEKLKRTYAKKRNAYNIAVRADKQKYGSSKLFDGVSASSSVWQVLKKFDPTPCKDDAKPEISIKGKSGTDLANHMAKFFHQRAKLVSDEEAEKHIHNVPFPKENIGVTIDIDDTKKYDAEELFKGKKSPSLAAGPDTISHRHLQDLMPVLKPVLQKAIDKPLNKFQNIEHNYLRLLGKDKKPGAVFTEKSQRPISELDIIPKYGAIKIFIDQLRKQLVKLMNDNQFAFPGKGGPMAIVTALDFFAAEAAKKSKAAFILWDFSNAFCTTIHYLTTQIAMKFNLSPRIISLLNQFLKQTLSTIKMSDKNGVYFSEETDMERGGCQGQIGSDFIFSLINDQIQPETIFDEIIKRVKYVDDFTDIISALTSKVVFDSLDHNEKRIVSQATSIGLKINKTKFKLLLANIPESEVPARYIKRGEDQILVTNEKLLGFEFEVVNPNHDNSCKKACYLSGNRAAKALIARLNESVRIICALRKVCNNLEKKVDAAISLVYSSCYDIGLVYAYADTKHFNSVSVAIRRVLKAAGLDYMADSVSLHRATLKISPALMAKKQIIQLGINFLNKA